MKWVQEPVPQAELDWFMDPKCFEHWGHHAVGGFRCLYFNSSAGCHNPRCTYVKKCFVCGQDHSAVSHHKIGDTQTA